MRFARPIATLLLAVGVATCSDTPIAPVKTGTTPSLKPGVGRLALAPAFSKTAEYVAEHAAAFPSVQFDSVHIVIRGNPDTTTIVKDTTIFFDPTSLSITLNLDVPVTSDNQRFNAAMAYKGPSGVVYSGSVIVQSHAPDQPAQPATITVNYVGPGSKVKSISVSPKSITLLGTQATILTVSAVDSSGAGTAVPPLSWSSSDGSVVSVSSTGAIAGLNKRGSATITASTPTGLSDNATVSVALSAASIAVVSGGGQTGKIGTALANPAVVQVSAVDGLGVAGVSVVFSAPAGGSVSPTTATTDGSGRASVSMKLGSAVGPQGFAATAAGFSTAISATATAGDPAAIAVVSGSGQSDTVGHALKAPLVVKVSDAGGNPVAGASVTWARTAGTGALGSTTTSSNSDGLASNTYTLGTAVGSEGVSASAAGQTAAFSFTALAGGAAKIASVSGDGQTGRVGQPLDAPFVVAVADAAGNPVSGATVTWAATNGTIAATSTAGANGQASATMTGGQTLGPASATASVGGQSVTFTATLQAGAPAKLVFTASPTSGVPNQALTPVQVAVRDLGGNPTTATTAVTVALGANAAGATLSGTTTRVAVNGTATFDDLKLDKVGTGFTLTASGGALSGGVSAPFSTAIGTPTQMTFVPGGQTSIVVTAGQSVTLPQVKVSDASGNGIAGIIVHAVVDTGTSHVARNAADLTTDASGLVTIPNDQPQIAGIYRVTLTSTSVPGASLTLNATVNPGPAVQVVFANKSQLSVTATSGVALSPQPVVRLVDAFGNVVPGTSVPITIAPTTSISVNGGTGTIPATSGQLALSNISLVGNGTVRLVVTAPSTSLLPDTTLVISVGPGAASKLKFTTSPAATITAGTTLSPAIAVEVEDQFGNKVNSATNTITLALSPTAAISGTNPKQANTGTASFGDLSIATPGTYTMTASGSGLTAATSTSFTVIAASLTASTTEFVQLVTASTLASMPTVNATSGGSPVAGLPVAFSVTVGSCSVNGNSSTSVNTDPSGNATLSSVTLPATAGSCKITATVAGGSSRTFTIVSAPTGTTRVWMGSADANWTNSSNWRALPVTVTPTVPSSTDIVYVPRNAFAKATLSGNVDMGGLTTEAGSEIDPTSANTYIMTVRGNVDLNGSFTAAHFATLRLEATGATTIHEVTGPGLTEIGGPTTTCNNGAAKYSLNGDVVDPYQYYIRCPLTVNGHTLSVGNVYTQTSRGVLVMRNSADSVRSSGNILFDGASETDSLTAGVLEAGSYFTQSSTNSSTSFVASGAHRTKFVGSSAQQVSFENATTSYFNKLEVKNSATHGFLLLSDVLVKDSLTVSSNGVIASNASEKLTVAGGVLATSGSNLSSLSLMVLTGSTFPSMAGSTPASVQFAGAGSLTMNAAQSFSGNVEILQPITVGAHTLTVQGDINVSGASGKLNLGTGSSVVANGSLTYGADVASTITDGSIEVKGTSFSIDEGASTPTTFAGGTLTFSGTSQQAILRNSSMSRLFSLVVKSGAAVSFQTDATAVSSVDVLGSSTALIMNDGSPNELLNLLTGATLRIHAGARFVGDLTLNGTATCAQDPTATVTIGALSGPTCTTTPIP